MGVNNQKCGGRLGSRRPATHPPANARDGPIMLHHIADFRRFFPGCRLLKSNFGSGINGQE
jgi:hypothetical protein